MDELFQSASVVGETADETAWLSIDHDFRRITIPAVKQLLGVTSDENVNVLHFRCPRFCNGVDLGDFQFRINYMNAAREGDVYLTLDKVVSDDEITFSWLVKRHACEYPGRVSFIVCAKLFNDDNDIIKEYNTALHTVTVVQGLETTEDIREEINANSDIVEQFLRNAQGIFEMQEDVEDLKTRVTDVELSAARKIDGAYVTEDGFLYLTVDSEATVGPLGPFSGGGGGGGGGGPVTNAIFTATNSSGWMSKTIATGGECVGSITWSSTENEIPTGDGLLQISVNSVPKATLQIPQGIYTFDLAKYCGSGVNAIVVTLLDVYQNKKIFSFSVNVTQISLAASFDTSLPFTGKIDFQYTPTGAVSKTVYFILDGQQIGTQVVTSSNRQQTYTIPPQTHGTHTLSVYFEAEINGETVQSNTLYYEFMSIVEGNNTVLITSPFNLTSVNQYSSITILYRVYNPASAKSDTQIFINNELVSSPSVDRTEQKYTYRAMTAGQVSVEIRSGNATPKVLTFTVIETEIDVEAETNDLVLYLNAEGRSNSEQTRNIWTYENPDTHVITLAQLSNFNWVLDGWQTDDDGITVMRLVDDSRLIIPFNIFETDFKTTGKTIEIEFATRQVSDYNAELLTCWADNRGLKITPQSITFRGAQTEFSTVFKENEHIRLSVVVQKQTEYRLMLIYINGIMSRAVQYASGEQLNQLNPVGISIGSNDCGIDIYNIRVYDNDLNQMQILDNWIADTQLGDVMLDRYQRNRVYNDSGEITIANLPTDLPYWILNAAELPQFKGDKKVITGSYTVPGNSARSFNFVGVEIDVQGTSSSVYYRKNYDLKFKEGFSMGNGTTSGTYAIREGSIPFNRFVLKADVASSESANNTELTMLYHDICPYRTPEMRANSKVRYGIEGIPTVVFWNNTGTGETKFIGKYNFNLPKRAPEPYGYGNDSTLESWEWERNNSGNVKFQDTDFTSMSLDEDGQPYPTWYDDFEARFPSDAHRDYSKLNEFNGWVKSTWRDQATNNILPEPVTYRLNSKLTLTDYASDESYSVVEVTVGTSTMYDITFTKDTPAYRLTKFRAEAPKYMEVSSAEFYYLFTEMFLMIDSRAKNMFVGFNGDPIT